MCVNVEPSRCLNRSKMYNSSNAKELSNALYSVLKKMAHNAKFIAPVPLFGSDRVYIEINENTWYWKAKIFDNVSFDFPPPQTQYFYLLRDFHGGADGKVWLACNSSGKLVIVKFLKHNDAIKANLEVARWKKLGFTKVSTMKLMGRQSILLPFAFHYDTNLKISNEWWKGHGNSIPPIPNFSEFLAKASELDPITVLNNCVKACAEKKLVHSDIEWRHVAMFPQSDESLKFSFLDLTNMKEVDSENDAITEMQQKVNEICNK
jgi:hypothetical protein